jgi:hypothetical protein
MGTAVAISACHTAAVGVPPACRAPPLVDFWPHTAAPRWLPGVSRLWSMEVRANLAVYKGHMLPVWDVAACPYFSPYYFASCGADRTARLWSTDRAQPLRLFVGAWRRHGAPLLRRRQPTCLTRHLAQHACLVVLLCSSPSPPTRPTPPQATPRTWTSCAGTPTATTWPPALQTAPSGCGTCAAASAAVCWWGTETRWADAYKQTTVAGMGAGVLWPLHAQRVPRLAANTLPETADSMARIPASPPARS